MAIKRAPRPSHPTVGDIMSSPPYTVLADERVDAARKALKTLQVHHLLVEDRGRIVGIVSDRDILRAMSPYVDSAGAQRRDDLTLQRPIYSIASYHLVTVPRDTPLEVAAALMLEHDISCLPVTGKDAEVLGIVTKSDLLQATLTCLIDARPAA